MKRRDLTKNQQRRLNYHMKRAENKIKEIKEKCCIKEDTTLEDKYILHRKLVITVMKIMIKDLFYNFRWEFDIFLDEEEEELSHLIQELLDKIIEEDKKIEAIYERIIKSKSWMKWQYLYK